MGAVCPPAQGVTGSGDVAHAGAGSHRVEVAATGLGLEIPGLQAFHTSVLVDGLEYYFGPSGVSVTEDCGSHRQLMSSPPIVLAMGFSQIPGEEMRRAVSPLFRAGSYDVLRKNCNSFSDCALCYLLGARLGWRFRGLDQVGATLGGQDSAIAQGLLRAAVGGTYIPNPVAAGFSLEESLRRLSKAREVRRTSGAWQRSRSPGRCVLDDLHQRQPRSSGAQGTSLMASGRRRTASGGGVEWIN